MAEDKQCCCGSKMKERSDSEKKLLLNRLKRIEGQIRGIYGMVENDAYCIDILNQALAEKNIQSDKDEALEEARDYYDFYRPVMVSLRHCTNVLLSGVTFMNSPAWNIHPFFCDN